MFGINSRKTGNATPTLDRQPLPFLRIYASDFHARDPELARNLGLLMPEFVPLWLALKSLGSRDEN